MRTMLGLNCKRAEIEARVRFCLEIPGDGLRLPIRPSQTASHAIAIKTSLQTASLSPILWPIQLLCVCMYAAAVT
eukprot:1361317-Amorphochlora_amoeboformis.AAC.1